MVDSHWSQERVFSLGGSRDKCPASLELAGEKEYVTRDYLMIFIPTTNVEKRNDISKFFLH